MAGQKRAAGEKGTRERGGRRRLCEGSLPSLCVLCAV